MSQPMTARQRKTATATAGGVAGWLLARLGQDQKQQPRLAMLERIAIAPRHSLALVEADGQRLLVATSAESGPVFYALDRRQGAEKSPRPRRRISW